MPQTRYVRTLLAQSHEPASPKLWMRSQQQSQIRNLVQEKTRLDLVAA